MAQRLDYKYSTNGHDRYDESIPELIKELASEAGTLVKQEVELAKSEMSEKAKDGGVLAGMFGAAALLGLAAFGTLTACFVAALATGTPVWLAALIVTVVYLAVAGGIVFIARNRIKTGPSLLPEQTIQSVKEDITWLKTHGQYDRT